MATTFETIRDRKCSTLEGLTPSKHSGQRFRRHREGDFTAWVGANAKACFRRFQIARNFDDEQLPTSDGSLEGCRHTMELRIAYPVGGGLYGVENERDMDDLIDADRRQIDAAIGLNGGANYVTGEDECRFTSMGFADVEGARVLSMIYSLTYDRSV